MAPLTGQRSLLRDVSDTGDLARRKRAEETAVFLQGMLDEPVDSATSSALREKTEGWITGLRLAALALRHRSDRNHIMTNLPEESRYLTDYLIALVYNFKSIIFWIGKSNL